MSRSGTKRCRTSAKAASALISSGTNASSSNAVSAVARRAAPRPRNEPKARLATSAPNGSRAQMPREPGRELAPGAPAADGQRRQRRRAQHARHDHPGRRPQHRDQRQAGGQRPPDEAPGVGTRRLDTPAQVGGRQHGRAAHPGGHRAQREQHDGQPGAQWRADDHEGGHRGDAEDRSSRPAGDERIGLRTRDDDLRPRMLRALGPCDPVHAAGVCQRWVRAKWGCCAGSVQPVLLGCAPCT